MKPSRNPFLHNLLTSAATLAFSLSLGGTATAASFYWDSDGSTTIATGGAGTWDTSGSLWRSLSDTGILGAWSNAPTDSTAVFGGSAGTVSIGAPISVNSMLFNTTGYTLSGGQTITLNGSTPTITLGSGISATIGNNTATVLDGSAGLTKNGTGTLTLNGNSANTFTGGLKINAGTLVLDYANLGTPTDLINSGNALTLGGGKLTVIGKKNATTSQTFNSTTINSGYSIIDITRKGTDGTGTTGSATLNLGAVTLNTGGVVIFTPNTAWSTTASTTEKVYVTTGGTITVPSSGTSYANAKVMYGTGTGTRWAMVNTSGQLLGMGIAATWVTSGASSTTVYNAGSTTQDLAASQSMQGILVNATATHNLGSATTAYTLTTNGIIHLHSGLLTLQQKSGIGGTLQIGAEKDLVINNVNSGGTTISAPIVNYNDGVSNFASGVTVNSTGSGVVTLSGLNTYTGTTTLNLGTLVANNAAALGASSAPLQLNGGTLEIKVNGSGINAYNTMVGGDVAIISNKATVSAGITQTLGTLSIGSNTLTLQRGSNLNAGSVGGLTFGATTLTGAPTFSVASLTKLTLGAVNNGANTMTFTGAGDVAQTGAWGSGAGGVIVDSGFSGTLALNQANTFSGGLTINGGTVSWTANSRLGADNGTITLNGGTLTTGTGDADVTSHNLTVGASGGTLQNTNSGGTVYYSSNISGAGNTLIIKTAANNAPYNLEGSVSLGTLTLGSATSTVGLRPTANITNAVSVGTGQILQLNASRNTASTVGNYTGFDVTLNGGALRNRYGVNTFDRSITLTAASSIIARDTGGSLTINSGKLALAGNSLTIDSPNATAFIAINGGVTGTAASSLNMNNAGQLRLSGTNASFLGSLAVTNGEVRLDSATALGSSNAVTFGDNANTKTLTLNGNHQTIGGLSTGATVGTSIIQNANATGATLSVDLASGSNTFGGVLQDGTGGGALGLQKQGSGMLTLSGTNTYTGATTVNEGALSVGGSLATGSAVTVNNGGALKGVGDINGATTIKSGGILAPGNSVGKLEVADVKFESGSIFEWELAATPEDSYEPDGTTLTSPSVRGTSYDSTTVTGTFDTSTTGAKFRIKLDGTQTFADNFWDTNQKWTDIFATSAGVAITDWANVFTGGFEYYNASGTMRAPDASTRGSFTFTGGSTLTWTAVPEPTSALVGLLITAGLLRRRRN